MPNSFTFNILELVQVNNCVQEDYEECNCRILGNNFYAVAASQPIRCMTSSINPDKGMIAWLG